MTMCKTFSILFLEKIMRLLMELNLKLTILKLLEYLKDILKFLFQMDHMVIGEHQVRFYNLNIFLSQKYIDPQITN